MVEVPVRPPRFLGEKVPYREQSMQEQIQSSLPGYTVEQVNGQYVAKANPVEYVSERRGANRTMSSYVPDELVISPEGQVLKETKRSTYKSDVFEHGQTQDVYESEVTDYQAQSRFTFGKRDLKSGRETIQQTSALEGGQYRENRIIHRDSKEYEMAKEQHDLFQNFVGQGMSYAQARQLSRASEVQREAYFKGVAQQRTQQFGLQAKAQQYARQESKKLNMEVQASAQQYSQNIATQQQNLASNRTRTDMGSPAPNIPQEKPDFTKGSNFQTQNPSSPTTRTDMSSLNIPQLNQKQSATMTSASEFYGKSNMVTSEKQYQRQQQLASDNPVQKVFDTAIFRLEETKLQDVSVVKTPFVSEIIAPATIGAGSIIIGTVSHPIKAVQSLLDPIGTAQNIQTQASVMTATKGEVYSLSFLGGTIVGGEVLGRAGGKAVEFAKDTYVKVGSKYREPETVFAPETLSGEKTFSTVRSTAESLERFNKGGKSYNLEVAREIVAHPESFVKETKATASKNLASESPVLRDLQSVIPSDQLVYTGGTARRILTGEGAIRDVDVVVRDTVQGRELAYKVAERYPEKYEIIKHEKYPEIYRIREKKTRKVVVDFDPQRLAEEGQIKSLTEDVVDVGGQKVVKPEVQLKSKAMQILKGKSNPKYPLKQGENIQALNPEIPIFENKVVVSTASPTALKGKTVTSQIEKIGLEDTGIYVTPKGEVSPYFTGIEPAETTYSFNPLKNFGVPTVTEFAINKVTTYPKEVLVTPGFEQLTGYQQANVGKGLAYVTKRSMIGTGDLARQKFFLKEQTAMSGKTVEAGMRTEAGTSEIEAVIGVGESFAYTPKTFIGKLKGFDEYTTYKGRSVAVRQGKVLTGTTLGGVAEGSVVISGSKVSAGQEALGSLARSEKVVTPLSSAKVVPYGSMRSASPKVKVVEYSAKGTEVSVGAGSVQSSFKSAKSSVSGVSKVSSKVSVVSSSTRSKVSIPKGMSRASEVSRPSESLLSGRSFGGSSTGGSSEKGSSGRSGGGSGRSGGGSSGGSYGAGQDYPREIVKSYSIPGRPEKKQKEQFAVQVRSKGEFKTIAIKETPEEAFNFGKFRVEQTASASLRVKPISSPGGVISVGKRVLPSKTFYESKKEPGVFVQRREARISTAGEKREITFKGIQMQRNKNIFGRR